MEKGVQWLLIVLSLLAVGLLIYFAIDSRHTDFYEERNVPYSNVAGGILYDLTPPSLLYNQDIEFWSKNTLIKKQFYIETKFGQTGDGINQFNYSISGKEDCEREFDKKNYHVQTYYQKSGIGTTDKYNVYTVRTCWIDSITPIKLECESGSSDKPCLYNSRVSCICVYAAEA